MPENSNAAQQQPVAPPAQPAKQPARVEGTRATSATNADLSPQQKWLNDQAAADARDPQRNPNIVLTKDAAGNLVVHEKKIGADGEATIGKPLDQPEGEAPAPDTAAGEVKHKFGADLELTETEIRDLVAHKAESDLRKAHVPATPNGYKIELSKDVVLPNGAEFKLASPNDPIKGPGLRAAMEWAHKKGFSQGEFSEMLGVYAAATSSEQIMVANAARAERDALGTTGPARVDAVLNWVKAKYPDAFRPVAATLATRAQIDMFESIISRLTNGGGGSLSQRGREVPEADGRLPSGAEGDRIWNSWSYSQQKEYSERFTQR